MKDKSINILIVDILFFSVMAIMLIILLGEAHNNFEGNITVVENGITKSAIPVGYLIQECCY